MILSDAEDIIYNGSTVEGVVFNNELIWPTHGRSVLNFYNYTNAPIGVSGYLGGIETYTREFGTGSFRINAPSGMNFLIGAVTPEYKKVAIQSDDLSFALSSRNRGLSATSYYTTPPLYGTATVTIPSIVNNDFYASGIFPAYTASSYGGAYGESAANLTYLSGDTTISGTIIRPFRISGYYGNTMVTSLQPDLTLSSISSYLDVRFGWNVGSTSDYQTTATASWHIGNIEESARREVKFSQLYYTAVSVTKNIFVLASDSASYSNSAFGSWVRAGYKPNGVTAYMPTGQTWAMTGIAP